MVAVYLAALIVLCETAQGQDLSASTDPPAGRTVFVEFDVKPGADVINLHPVMRDVFPMLGAAWAACNAGRFTITSGSEPEPLHVANSWHNRGGGRAVDVRANNLSLATVHCLSQELRVSLPDFGCNAIAELHPQQPARRHIHVQCPERED